MPGRNQVVSSCLPLNDREFRFLVTDKLLSNCQNGSEDNIEFWMPLKNVIVYSSTTEEKERITPVEIGTKVLIFY